MPDHQTTRWRRRLFIVAVAPVEIVACAFIAAWRQVGDSLLVIRDEWNDA
jgi:hypothetical protein